MNKIGNLVIGVSIVVSSLVLVGCGGNNSDTQLKIKTSVRSVNYLAARNDFSLYRFDDDVKDSDASSCYDTDTSKCATVWPPYNAGVLTQLDIDNGLGELTRIDGEKQTTYFGYPLYKFKNDINVGDTNGNFVNEDWHLNFPKTYDINAAGTKLSLLKINEKYMVDTKDFSLYTFDDDIVSNVSNCYDVPGGIPCATIWPPFYADVNANNISSDLNISLFADISRTDGKKQISYNGKPLYHFTGIAAKAISGDTNVGDTNGDWFKQGDWHLVQIK